MNLRDCKRMEKADINQAIATYAKDIEDGYGWAMPYDRLIAVYEKLNRLDEAILVALKYIEIISSRNYDDYSTTTQSQRKKENRNEIKYYKSIIDDLQYLKVNGVKRPKPKDIETITVIDFETANCAYSSACSIGIVQIVGHEITYGECFLIQPPDNFYEKRQMEIHGMSPQDTKDADFFPTVWEKIKPYFENTYLAAYNAIFDMTVLKGLFNYYDIQEPCFAYFDIMNLSGLKTPREENVGKKLEDCCAYFGVALDFHHDALCDAKAAAELALYAFNNSNRETLHSFANMQANINDFADVTMKKTYHFDTFSKWRTVNIAEIAATIDTSTTQKDDDFMGKVFVFTGELKKFTREQAYAKVIAGGGTIAPNVTKKVDVLVNADTAMTKKLKDALALQENGHHIKIVDDSTFTEMLESTDAICLED